MADKIIDTALLQQLRVLAAVVSERSVAGAANRLHVTQPAVSNALARLRTKVRDPLIVKVGNQATPTARAIQIAQVAMPALAAMHQVIERTASFVPESAKDTIRLGMPDYLEHIIAPVFLRRLRESAPNLTLILRPCNAESVSEQLDSGDLDLGLTMARPLPSWQRASPLFEETFICLIPNALAPKGNALTLAKFLSFSHAMVSFRGVGQGQVDVALARIGKQRRMAATATSFGALGELLASAKLVACVPHPIAPRLSKMYGLRTFALPFAIPSIQMSLCEANARSGEAKLNWVRQQIIECVRVTKVLHS
jgi:LysR family transcriptional regulator, mexEF-oprN operon transcriptional activator